MTKAFFSCLLLHAAASEAVIYCWIWICL
uniref:Uncharacterized protein n=1 Tax=Arundo donax TaxID=35708 RepID=A0A0A8ZWH9_ARUDO